MSATNEMLDTRLRLRDVCDHIHAHHHSSDESGLNLKWARDKLALALVPDAPHGAGEAWLIDVIADAIDDSTDIDCTSESQARYIVDVLFAHLHPKGE